MRDTKSKNKQKKYDAQKCEWVSECIHCNERMHVTWIKAPQWCAWQNKKKEKQLLDDGRTMGHDVYQYLVSCALIFVINIIINICYYILSITSVDTRHGPSPDRHLRAVFLYQKKWSSYLIFLLTHFHFKCNVCMFVCLTKRKFPENMHIVLSCLIKKIRLFLAFCVLWSSVQSKFQSAVTTCKPLSVLIRGEPTRELNEVQPHLCTYVVVF